ncbi:MAG: hypothetical protein DRI57_05045 [Deltaproteobacteria bacterium]|nr:MAG: hypothetical protein DRI57_05045 [Deltaproteobacteria bacterium]
MIFYRREHREGTEDAENVKKTSAPSPVSFPNSGLGTHLQGKLCLASARDTQNRSFADRSVPKPEFGNEVAFSPPYCFFNLLRFPVRSSGLVAELFSQFNPQIQ